MRKEVLIAVLIGLGLGLIITYGVYTATTASRTNNSITDSDTTASPNPGSIATSTELVVTNPLDESIQRNAEITITGTTWPKAFVVILINGLEIVTTTDDNGGFSVKKTLQAGGNIIEITALNEDGKVVTQERTVTLATDLEVTASPEPSSSPALKAASPSPTAKPR